MRRERNHYQDQYRNQSRSTMRYNNNGHNSQRGESGSARRNESDSNYSRRSPQKRYRSRSRSQNDRHRTKFPRERTPGSSSKSSPDVNEDQPVKIFNQKFWDDYIKSANYKKSDDDSTPKKYNDEAKHDVQPSSFFRSPRRKVSRSPRRKISRSPDRKRHRSSMKRSKSRSRSPFQSHHYCNSRRFQPRRQNLKESWEPERQTRERFNNWPRQQERRNPNNQRQGNRFEYRGKFGGQDRNRAPYHVNGNFSNKPQNLINGNGGNFSSESAPKVVQVQSRHTQEVPKHNLPNNEENWDDLV